MTAFFIKKFYENIIELLNAILKVLSRCEKTSVVSINATILSRSEKTFVDITVNK